MAGLSGNIMVNRTKRDKPGFSEEGAGGVARVQLGVS